MVVNSQRPLEASRTPEFGQIKPHCADWALRACGLRHAYRIQTSNKNGWSSLTRDWTHLIKNSKLRISFISCRNVGLLLSIEGSCLEIRNLDFHGTL
jgi:hypothetical protein